MFGGPARDILIGGDGHDFLFGNRGDDILIGGSTASDANQAQLLQLLTAWTDPKLSYNDRVAAIRAGTGGVPKLDATTVSDDGTGDLLVGGPGLDWFFPGTGDHVAGKKPAEQTG